MSKCVVPPPLMLSATIAKAFDYRCRPNGCIDPPADTQFPPQSHRPAATWIRRTSVLTSPVMRRRMALPPNHQSIARQFLGILASVMICPLLFTVTWPLSLPAPPMDRDQ
jgi:hypothetical protein